jgi:hypothetical protein
MVRDRKNDAAVFSVSPEAVASLAECGLTLAEIFAELGVPSALPLSERQAAEAAFRKGRASGIARIKRAQFEAALSGKTGAQAQVLRSLGALPADESAITGEVAVVREIIGAEDDGAEG